MLQTIKDYKYAITLAVLALVVSFAIHSFGKSTVCTTWCNPQGTHCTTFCD